MVTTQVFSSTADGSLHTGNTTTYTNAADGVGDATLANDPGGANEVWIGQLNFAGSFACYEAFLDFDLSSIPVTHTVSAVTLATWLTVDQSGTNFLGGVRVYDWGASVTVADWQSRAEIDALGATLATLDSNGIGAVGAYKNWISNAAFLDAVQAALGGTLRLLLYSGNHRQGLSPSGAEFLQFASANTAGTTNDPRLTVTHVPGEPLFQRTTPRVWRLAGRT